MARIERNLVANFLGIGIAAGAPLLFNIVYFRLLGSEAYGLVGLFLTVQMVAVSLDLGLTRATTREVARAMSQTGGKSTIRSSVFTLLVLNVLVFFSLGIAVIAASGWISGTWLQQTVVDGFEVSTAICLIGAVAAIQQPRSIFLGALNGLQGQVLTNILTAGSAISRGVVTLLVLARSPDLSAFFWTQLVMTVIETLVIALVVWSRLPASGQGARFESSVVRGIARFAMGDGFNVIIGALVIHGDKLLLSGLVPLSAFGTYSLLSLIAQSLGRLAAPYTIAYFPPLVALWQQGDTEGLVDCFRRASLGFASLLVPATLAIITLAEPVTQIILPAGSGFPDAGIVLVLLSLAFSGNAMMHLPYTLQLASGWTRAGLIMNATVFFFYIPLLFLLVPVYGVIAAAWILLAAMWIPLPLFIEVTRRHLLGGHAWWKEVFVVPIVISACCFLPVYFAARVLNPWLGIATGAIAGLVALFLINAVTARQALKVAQPEP